MLWIVLLLILTTLVLAGLVLVALKLGRRTDEVYGALTKNQWRALAYLAAFLICLIAVYIEWKIVIAEPKAEQARQVERVD